MENDLNELVNKLEANQGGNLVSVVAFGSAVAAPAEHQKRDYQVLIVARRLTAEDLRRARAVVEWFTSLGYAIPVFFTAAEFVDSLDVYPIEFAHMKQAYRVLYGEDPLAPHAVSREHLRWQTEYELRGKLLRLRSLYLPASMATEDMVKLMTDSVVSFVRFLRAVLELKGEMPPLGRLATVIRTEETIGVDTSALVRILELRDEPRAMMEIEAQDLFASYLDCLGHVIEAVDKM